MSKAVYRNLFSMGTRLDMVFPGIEDEIADQVYGEIKNEIENIENQISNYIDDGDLFRINLNASKAPVVTNDGFIQLFSELKELSEKTLGYFDFTFLEKDIGRDSGASYKSMPRFPLKSREPYLFRNVIIRKEDKTIAFNHYDLKIDSGGFGKGMGLDLVKMIIQNAGIPSAFISFGESSVLAFGKHPYGEYWKTGIRSIFAENENIYTFNLLDEFLSTSGTTPDNIKKYGMGHIVNPFTGEPVNSYITAAVSGKNGITTEVLSTALLIAPEQMRNEIISNFPEHSAVIFEYDKNQKPVMVFNR